MRTFIVRNDTNLRSLGATLLDARFRGAQADASLERLRALNPHVDPTRIPSGTVLFVPDSPGFKTSATASAQSGPLDDFRALLSGALNDAAEGMKAANATRAAERADVAAVLRSAAFKRVAGNDPDLAQQVADTQKAMTTEESDDKQAEQTFVAMSRAALAALAQMEKVAG